MSIVNKRVILAGLRSRSDLNGSKGVVMSYDRTRDRYNVSLGVTTGSASQFENMLAVKEENLILEESFEAGNRDSGQSRFIESLLSKFQQAATQVFREKNLGLSAVLFLTASIFFTSWVTCTMTTLWSLFFLELMILLQRQGSMYRNFASLKEKFHNVELAIGTSLTRYFRTPVYGGPVVFLAVAGYLALKKYASSRQSYYDGYYHDDGYMNGSGFPFSFGGVSIISIIFLIIIIKKLDIPNNGLAALQNLNFFEIMYLYNILSDIFGGRRRNRRPYGGGYRGYGRRAYW